MVRGMKNSQKKTNIQLVPVLSVCKIELEASKNNNKKKQKINKQNIINNTRFDTIR